MKKPNHANLFSVIVPTFNRAHTITAALDSIRAQTYRPIEIIVIDDGSTDGTKPLLDRWVSQFTEQQNLTLHYFFQTNCGPSAARNLGVEKALGEYIQFLDSDDRLHPQRFRRVVEAFENLNADFVQTGFDGFDSQTGEIVEKHYSRPEGNQVELALTGHLWANTLRSSFRRSLVQRIGPWCTEMTCFEDREYVERAVMWAERPVAVREILASARRGGDKRVSDRLRTYDGRKWRVLCEERLAKMALERNDISDMAKRAFCSRIYALGFRSNARGWFDLGQRCGEIAQLFDVELDAKGRLRRLVWRSGWVGGSVYGLLAKLKRCIGFRWEP